MKLSVDRLAVVASSPPTLTRAPAPNSTPLPLTRKTWPLAVSRPRMVEGVSPRTRFSTAALAPGWRKRTSSRAPMSKLRQSMTARGEVCTMLVTSPLRATKALPAFTASPAGPAQATGAPASRLPAPRPSTASRLAAAPSTASRLAAAMAAILGWGRRAVMAVSRAGAKKRARRRRGRFREGSG